MDNLLDGFRLYCCPISISLFLLVPPILQFQPHVAMAEEDNYNYLRSLPLIFEFENPFDNVPFIQEMEENYGKLWQFKDCICNWSLGVSGFKNYMYVLHCKSSRGRFLPLNLDEKIMLLENFYQEYVVITLQAAGARDEDTPHLHSIVVKIGDGVASFNINSLLDTLAETSMELLRPKLESKYAPWTYTSTESAFIKISSIYCIMSRYAARGGSSIPPALERGAPQPIAMERVAS